ncbi:glycosyltransferase family protein [Arthrobacter celericrescens]|uniref:glycosyltransferase family protein n=1 Tax=Arthrobacter celericrescens TaxID=2320851 RepID=UPI000EA29AC8|nr:glycosyltransferase [Arthrobacter celericrescens]
MRVLFCSAYKPESAEAGHAHFAAVGRLLGALGNTAFSMVAASAEVAEHLDAPPARTFLHSGSEIETEAEFIRGFASAVHAGFEQDDFDLVLADGLLLNQELARRGFPAARLWSFLPAADVASRTSAGPDGLEALQAVVQYSGFTLVEDAAQRHVLRQAAPTANHRVQLVDTCDARKMHAMQGAQRRVLLYRRPGDEDVAGWASRTYRMASSVASADVHVIVLCHDGLSIFESVEQDCPDVTVLQPATAAHQVENGRLLPRFAAWHVAVAASDVDCCAVLTDDLETVVSGFTNSVLRRKLWPLIDFGSLEEFNRSSQLFQQFAETASRLVFVRDEARAVLESRIPAATSKGVLLPTLGFGPEATPSSPPSNTESDAELFRDYLDRAVADYAAVPLLPVKRRVLVAGHDFKFAGELIDVLSQRQDVELRADHWVAQNQQDEAQSRTLLEWADLIFCEFASHNAVWYSWEKLPGQTLVVRFHGYELFSPWIQEINLANVDRIIFVSEFYRNKVIEELGWPREKTAVIPNVVDVLDLNRPKKDGARFHIGIAGIVPILKRPDRALDILEQLLATDPRYTVHIRGRAPWDYGWMWQDEVIREAYEAFYERIALNPGLRRRVAFDEFGPDMGRWFQNIGWMLSPSFRETFHLAPVEGMASGAVPVVWEREGAEEIFGNEWVHEDTSAAVEYIKRVNENPEDYAKASEAAVAHARQFDLVKNGHEWLRLLLTLEGTHSGTPGGNVTAEASEGRFHAKPNSVSLSRLFAVLERDGDLDRIRELAAEHPDLVDRPSQRFLFDRRWKEGVEALKDELPRIPERSEGAAYLVRPESVLFVVDETRSAAPETAWPAAVADGVAGGSLHLVTVASAAINPAFDAEDEGRTEIELGGVAAVRIPLRNSAGLRLPKFVLAATDAIVREARAFRPAAIAAQGDFWVALPALLAARRLGVPFLSEDLQDVPDDRRDGELSARCAAQADAAFARGSGPLASVSQAQQSYSAALSPAIQRDLASMKVGVIADQFTSATIAHSFETVPLSRTEGFVQVASLDLDAIFVESAWEGPDYQWRRGVAYYPGEIADLERIIKVARARDIPVIFWNKEDPVHFRAFERTAAMMDHVFTTDADMVGKYLQNDESVVQTVSSLPFYAEPAIHNPLPTDRPYQHTVSYAGTYYGDRFKERSDELHRILDAAKLHGLTIYDRQVNVPNSPYRFPPELAPFVREGVPYQEVLKVYKAHPVSINVNSANDSPTMFSRRVVEVAASGSVVLSGRGRGITEQIQGIEAGDSDERWAELLSGWMTDEKVRLETAWNQMRTITRSHLADQALTIVMRTAGIPVVAPALPAYAVVAASGAADVEAMTRQSWRPTVVFADHLDAGDRATLEQHGIAVAPESELDSTDVEWLANWENVPSDTYFEDLLHATRFGDWDLLSARPFEEGAEPGGPIIELERCGTFAEIRRAGSATPETDQSALTWVVIPARS